MKKYIPILFLVLLPVLTFADARPWWYGGPARMASMGELQTAVTDLTNIYDLYSYGFPAVFLWRNKRDIIGISPYINIRYAPNYKYYNDFGAANNFIGCWMGNNDAVVLLPEYQKQDMWWRNSKGNSNYISSGKIQYMHKMADDTGFSTDINYSTNNDLFTNPDFVSEDMVMSADICLAKHLGDFNIPFLSGWLPKLDLAADVGYNAENITLDSTSMMAIFDKEYNKLITANIGFSFIEPGKKAGIVISAGRGFVVKSEHNYDITGIDGARFDFNGKANYFVTDYLVASAKVRYLDPDYNEDFGIALSLPGLLIPIEYIKNDIYSDNDISHTRTESYGGGVEWTVMKIFDIRLGARQNGVNKSFGYFYELDYTAGLGIELNNFLCDIGVIYCPFIAQHSTVNSYTNILADLKFVF